MSLRTRSLSLRTAAWLRRSSWCKEQQLFSAGTTSFPQLSLRDWGVFKNDLKINVKILKRLKYTATFA
jgi:hypothetical protein